MADTKTPNEKHVQLMNGLTLEQVEKARKVLSMVNISTICQKTGVKLSTVYNVLRDKSPRVADLNKVLREAERQAKKKKKVLKAFPL